MSVGQPSVITHLTDKSKHHGNKRNKKSIVVIWNAKHMIDVHD